MFFSLEELDALSPYISYSKKKTIRNLTVAAQFFSKEKQGSIINELLLKVTETDSAEYQYLYELITDNNRNTN